MTYSENKKVLLDFYTKKGLEKNFDRDNDYLAQAFGDIQKLWLENFNQIKKINYLMIAEAPLWGDKRKYIYNPLTRNSQFFHRNDLGHILEMNIGDKVSFIEGCNKSGLLIIDVSPFALNPADTSITYRKLPVYDYRWLVGNTMPLYFEKKLDLIESKKTANLKIFFRYSRVKAAFQDLIGNLLIKRQWINQIAEIGEVSKRGGGIDRLKLIQMFKKEKIMLND